MGDAELLVIVPSRGRPHAIHELWSAWQATTTGAVSLLVAVDDDDPTLDAYVEVCARFDLELVVGPRLRLGGTLNKLATERAQRHYALGFMGDDHRPRVVGWNERFVAELRNLGTGIVYGDDLLRGEALPTAVAMTSDIVMTLGYMVPAGLEHLWCDNAWYDLGHGIDRIAYLPDVVIEHLHPAIGKGDWDDTYRECNSEAQNDADLEKYRTWAADGLATDVAKLKALL